MTGSTKVTTRKRRVGSIRVELLSKSREATLSAVQTFNNPLTTFKTESFIVTMVIAWTYLMHAYFRAQVIDYRYYDKGPKRRKFHRTKSGGFRHWDLERCLNDKACPLGPNVKNNLRFLIGLRHEIEHHGSAGVDERLTGRYLACCLNYEEAVTRLFGDQHSLSDVLAFPLQFKDITRLSTTSDVVEPMPSNVAK